MSGQWLLAAAATAFAWCAHQVGHTAESGMLFAGAFLIAARAVENGKRIASRLADGPE